MQQRNPDLQPCRSPYCECSQDQCARTGFYDARSEPRPSDVITPGGGLPGDHNGVKAAQRCDWDDWKPSKDLT